MVYVIRVIQSKLFNRTTKKRIDRNGNFDEIMMENWILTTLILLATSIGHALIESIVKQQQQQIESKHLLIESTWI